MFGNKPIVRPGSPEVVCLDILRFVFPAMLFVIGARMTAEIEQKREQLADLCRRHHVRRLALFGSALRDDFDPQHSDLDFVVEFGLLPPGTYSDI